MKKVATQKGVKNEEGVLRVKTEGLVHFTIPVSDVERTARFYTELLGMRILRRNPSMVFLKCGRDYLVLAKSKVPIRPNAEGDTVIHHAFKVAAEEFDRSVEFLKQMACRF